MDPVVSGIIGTLLVFFLLSLGMPIAFSMMLVGFLGIALLSSPASGGLNHRAVI